MVRHMQIMQELKLIRSVYETRSRNLAQMSPARAGTPEDPSPRATARLTSKSQLDQHASGQCLQSYTRAFIGQI